MTQSQFNKITSSSNFLYKAFDELNKEFFNGELPKIEMKWSNSRKACGQYFFKYNLDGTETPNFIKISKFWIQEKINLYNVILHEMIHYYLSIHNLAKNERSHGPSFLKMMFDFNRRQSQYRVSIYTKVDSKNISNQNKTYHLLVATNTLNRKRFIARIPSNTTIENLERQYGHSIEDMMIVKTTNPKIGNLRLGIRKLHTYHLDNPTIKKYDIKKLISA